MKKKPTKSSVAEKPKTEADKKNAIAKPVAYHPILASRISQIVTNMLALRGGRPYIDARLSRFPAESDIDFEGLTAEQALAKGLNACQGRKQRAYCPNYSGRIAKKIDQYVFKTPVVREGIDPLFAMNCTATGKTISQFMEEASSLSTAVRWCWAGVDRPRSIEGESRYDKRMRGDRVFWRLYEPQEVINWEYDCSGKLLFVVTREETTFQARPLEQRKVITRYTVWEPNLVTVFDNDAVSSIPTGTSVVPFVQIGNPSALPWWFDDVEMCQKTLLDKQSALDTAIYKAVYPLLVIPQSVVENMKQEGVQDTAISKNVRLKIGMSSPIQESIEESGITRYVTGSTVDIAFIRTEITSAVKELYETVGLAMQVESRDAASAEAKAWDHLDAGAVLAQRAEMLENAEKALVEISDQIGSGGAFKAWEPKYAREFDISNLDSDMAATVQFAGLPCPSDAMQKLIAAAYERVAARLGVPKDKVAEAMKSIETYKPESGMVPTMGGSPFAQDRGA